jgi:hypothetical protein
VQPIVTIDKVLTLKESIEDRLILNMMQNMYPSNVQIKDHTNQPNKERSSSKSLKTSIVSQYCSNAPFSYLDDYFVVATIDSRAMAIGISLGKLLNININL